MAASGSTLSQSAKDRRTDVFDADMIVPISPSWQTAPIAKPIDAATDHAQLLASLRVTRASIARNAIGHHMSEALFEDTVESLTVPGGPVGRDTTAMRPNRADQEESVRYMTRPVSSQQDVQPPQAQPPPLQPLQASRPTSPSALPSQPEPRASAEPRLPAQRLPVEAEFHHLPEAGLGTEQDELVQPDIDPLTSPLSSLDVDEPVVAEETSPSDMVPTLPIRVPAAPDVPDVPDDDDDYADDEAEASAPENPELTRIASRLRHDEPPAEPPADLDVTAVLEAVRGVTGVANAHLRGNPGGMHTLRLDLAEGADPGRVSRQVARLLKERMGLAAEPRRSRSGGNEPLVEEPPTAPPAMNQPSGPPVRPVPPADEPPLFPRPRPSTLSDVAAMDGRLPDPPTRITVDQVRVSTLGSEATVEVRLATGGVPSVGAATGPAVDGYLLRLAAQAAASAIDGLVEASPTAPQIRCFVDHAGVVPFGSCVVAVVVVLVSGAGWVEQLVGSAIVAGDPRQAIVRATLAAMNRRLESLLA